MSTPRGRTRAFRSLLELLGVALVTILLLAGIELGAGLLIPESREGSKPPGAETPDDTVSRTIAFNPVPLIRDVDLLWRNEPGARRTLPVNPRLYGRDEHWTLAINSEGFRGPERTSQSGRGNVYRIVCVGDSITFGFNVDQSNTYPMQLAALLAERHRGMRFDVVNAGVSGWTWLQGLRFLRTRGLSLAPDLVLIGHGTNDQLTLARITDEERFRRIDGRFTKAILSVGAAVSRTNSYRLIELFIPPPQWAPDRDSPGCLEQIRRRGSCHRVSLGGIADSVREVDGLTRSRGIELLVMNLDFTETKAVEGIRLGAMSHHVPFLDLVDIVRTAARREDDQRADRLGLAPATRAVAKAATATQGVNHAILRVVAPDDSERYTAVGMGYFRSEFTFTDLTYDDGTHGDEHAGDGVFSTTITVPSSIDAIQYRFYRGEVAEFTPLPPLESTLGDRLLRVPGDVIGPVHVFGEVPFMAERAHPNGEGQRRIAATIADRIEQLPSLRQFVGVEGPEER
jgi:lysophospholipase L1-like esterase